MCTYSVYFSQAVAATLNDFISAICFCRYNKLAGMVKSLSCKLKELDPRDPFRNRATTQLLEKL